MLKKATALILLLTMLASTAIAAEGFLHANDPITMTGFATAGPYTKGNFNDLAIWRVMEEMTGITIDFEAAPSGQSGEKLGLLFASNTLPDIIFKTGLSATDIATYAEEGQLIAIDPYLDEYAPNFTALMEERPEIRKAITMADGHIYGFPYLVTASPSNCSPKLFINTKALEALNAQIPTTLTELTELLRVFKQTDYNGNGVADEIPWASEVFSQVFMSLHGTFGLGTRGSGNWDIDPATNALRYIPVSDGYRDLLAYVASLYQEGLLDEEVFTAELATLTAKAEQNRLLFITAHNVSYTGSYMEDYVGIEPFVRNAGDEKQWAGQSLAVYANNTFITSNCKDPAAAVQYFDYFYGNDGIRLFFMGIEGETYEFDKDGMPRFTEYVTNNPDGMNMEEALGTYICWSGGGNPSVADDIHFGSQLINETTVTAAQILLQYGPEEIWPRSFPVSTEDAELLAEYELEIGTYIADMRAKFITGSESLDNWDKFIEQLNRLGLQEYIQLNQSALDKYNQL
jgi:putative aldouronate transport system substrate-binding protein